MRRVAAPRPCRTVLHQDQPPANCAFDCDASLFGSNIADERYLADCKVEDPSGTYVVKYDPLVRG